MSSRSRVTSYVFQTRTTLFQDPNTLFQDPNTRLTPYSIPAPERSSFLDIGSPHSIPTEHSSSPSPLHSRKPNDQPRHFTVKNPTIKLCTSQLHPLPLRSQRCPRLARVHISYHLLLNPVALTQPESPCKILRTNFHRFCGRAKEVVARRAKALVARCKGETEERRLLAKLHEEKKKSISLPHDFQHLLHGELIQ